MGRYNRHTVNGVRDYTHRHVWRAVNGEIPKGMTIDHINEDKHDNRIENLQLLSNAANLTRNKRGGVQKRGLNWTRPWRAMRTIQGVVHEQYFGTRCGALMFNNTRSLIWK